MANDFESLDAAIAEIENLKRYLAKGKTLQVKSINEVSAAKAIYDTWFNTRKIQLINQLDNQHGESVDGGYAKLLELTHSAGSRSKYLATIKDIRHNLIQLKKHLATSFTHRADANDPSDRCPPFSNLSNDPITQRIFEARWNECIKCIAADAPLAATVMMGALLETVLLTRINRESNKASIYKAAAAPKNSANTTKPLGDWTLHNFIEVAHELRWITSPVKGIGSVLRDYRNYIHPNKQITDRLELQKEDALLFWAISKSIIQKLVK